MEANNIEDGSQQHRRPRNYKYELLGATYHRPFGTAMYVRSKIDTAKLIHTASDVIIQQMARQYARQHLGGNNE